MILERDDFDRVRAFQSFPLQLRIFRGGGGIGAAPRLAAAHRAADTNAPGGRLNQTPGAGACVSHVAACAVLGPEKESNKVFSQSSSRSRLTAETL